MPWKRLPPRDRHLSIIISACGALALGVGIGTAFVTPIASHLAVPDDWIVVACDVGQGDALLLRHQLHPEMVMLVDTGNDPPKLLHCLDLFGVDKITLLVLSHDDQDHVGALPAIVERVETALIAPPSINVVQSDRPIVRQLEYAGVEYTIGLAGVHSVNLTGVDAMSWEVLGPSATAMPADTNEASLILRVQINTTSVLLLGDTGQHEQAELLRAFPELTATIVKVAHHGSRDHDPNLPSRIRAQWAVISVGAGNSYGHPAKATLAGFEAAGSHTLRTDLEGSVALRTTENGLLSPWLEHPHDTGTP